MKDYNLQQQKVQWHDMSEFQVLFPEEVAFLQLGGVCYLIQLVRLKAPSQTMSLCKFWVIIRPLSNDTSSRLMLMTCIWSMIIVMSPMIFYTSSTCRLNYLNNMFRWRNILCSTRGGASWSSHDWGPSWAICERKGKLLARLEADFSGQEEQLHAQIIRLKVCLT